MVVGRADGRARGVVALHRRGRALALGLLLAGVVLAVCPCAFGLDPALDVSQYAHTAWKVREGFTKGQIDSIAQTPDGYLWLGTEFGLVRFDGVRPVPWQPPPGQHLPSLDIWSLATARDGTLWIGTSKGLASWKDGKFTQYPELAGRYIFALIEDHEGTVWASGFGQPFGKLCAIRDSKVQCYGENGSLGLGAVNLYVDSKGNLWAGVKAGLWRWNPGPPIFYPLAGEPNGIQALAEDADGALLVGWKDRIWRFVEGKTEEYGLRGTSRRFRSKRILRDRDGGLWIGTQTQGLVHVHQGQTDVFSLPDGLTGEDIDALLEDREGSIWVVARNGLDRFRELAVPTLTPNRGSPNGLPVSVLADRDGSILLGTSHSLYRWRSGQISTYDKREGKLNGLAPSALFQDDRGRIWVSTRMQFGYLDNDGFVPVNTVPNDPVHGIAVDTAGNLWVDYLYTGLFQLSKGTVVRKIPWATLGHNDAGTALAADPEQGGLWVGFFNGGITYYRDGQVRASYTSADGLGEGWVTDLRLDGDGSLWAATQGGLSRLKNGRMATLTSKNGLPCDGVHWLMEDDAQSMWLNMPCGLVRIARPDMDQWAAAVDRNNDATRSVQATVFDGSDGVRISATRYGFTPLVAKSRDGKLWFINYDGFAVLDPRRLPFNKLPPAVHVEQITADHNVYWQNAAGDASASVHLPAQTRDLQIDYTALSYVAPEKNRFRVKLEGWDSDWQWVGNRRQAFYTNLSPGDYRFRVAASNNSGVWNEAGTSFAFSIAPAYYQTTWFRLSCVAAFLALLWALYQLRLRQATQRVQHHMEGRVEERMRIARELHDTMLQSFQGAVLHFQVVSGPISKRPQEAIQKLDSALDLADQAIAEGRNAVQGLRSSATETNDIAAAMITLGKGLAASETNHNCPEFRVDVVGATRDLHPITRDEVCRIAGEALRNAFKHAQASRIEVEIQYGPHKLRLRIRDNGKGLEPLVVSDKGRPGHYGLSGMRERAKLVGGNLEFWTKVQAGTEIELTIPAAAAYAKPDGQRGSKFFRKGAGAD